MPNITKTMADPECRADRSGNLIWYLETGNQNDSQITGVIKYHFGLENATAIASPARSLTLAPESPGNRRSTSNVPGFPAITLAAATGRLPCRELPLIQPRVAIARHKLTELIPVIPMSPSTHGAAPSAADITPSGNQPIGKPDSGVERFRPTCRAARPRWCGVVVAAPEQSS